MSLGPKPYRNLIVLLSRRCQLRCPDCNIRPELDNGQILSPGILEKFITASTRQLVRGGIIWTGGEPFETPDELLYGLQLAQNHDFYSEILTSGFWHARSKEILHQLHPFVNRLNIRLSLDGPHLQHLQWKSLKNLAERILDQGFTLSFTLRDNDPFRRFDPVFLQNEIIELFRHHSPGKDLPGHLFHRMPHMPQTSCAAKGSVYPGASYPEYRCKLAGKDFVLAWDGLQYACCGLFVNQDNRRFSLENDANRSIFTQLRQLGPLAMARKMQIVMPKQDAFYQNGPCPLCQYLWVNHFELLMTHIPIFQGI